MFLACMYYRYHERMGNFFRLKRLQYQNKYKRRWVNRYNPEAIVLSTAIDASYYRPQKLKKEEADNIGHAFVKVDSELANGFSRQLVINILNRMNVMDDKEQKEFLRSSEYTTIRKQMLCSCNLKTLYELIESKLPSSGYTIKPAAVKQGEIAPEVKQYGSDQEFVADFLALLKDELVDVSDSNYLNALKFEERVEKMIKLLE